MATGIVGVKCGMSRLFSEGRSIPVTVIHAEPNVVVQVKTQERDGYQAIQLGFGEKKPSRVSKPVAGHHIKAEVKPTQSLHEFRVDDSTVFKLGDTVGIELFSVGQKVDVTGTSKGRGFSGPIRRWNMSEQDHTHGNSKTTRAHGSTGQNQTPGRTFPGKKMAGQWGNARCTIQSLEVVGVDSEKNVLLIKGAVPGPSKGLVIVRPAVKESGEQA